MQIQVSRGPPVIAFSMEWICERGCQEQLTAGFECPIDFAHRSFDVPYVFKNGDANVRVLGTVRIGHGGDVDDLIAVGLQITNRVRRRVRKEARVILDAAAAELHYRSVDLLAISLQKRILIAAGERFGAKEVIPNGQAADKGKRGDSGGCLGVRPFPDGFWLQLKCQKSGLPFLVKCS